MDYMSRTPGFFPSSGNQHWACPHTLYKCCSIPNALLLRSLPFLSFFLLFSFSGRLDDLLVDSCVAMCLHLSSWIRTAHIVRVCFFCSESSALLTMLFPQSICSLYEKKPKEVETRSKPFGHNFIKREAMIAFFLMYNNHIPEVQLGIKNCCYWRQNAETFNEMTEKFRLQLCFQTICFD